MLSNNDFQAPSVSYSYPNYYKEYPVEYKYQYPNLEVLDDNIVYEDNFDDEVVFDIDRQVADASAPIFAEDEIFPPTGLGDLSPLLLTSALIVGLRYRVSKNSYHLSPQHCLLGQRVSI